MKISDAIWYLEEYEKSHNFSSTESVAWQTLKTAVLAQQTNNSVIPCPAHCKGEHCTVLRVAMYSDEPCELSRERA